MIYEFRLPDIGEGVVEGEVVRWLVEEGDPLRLDQPMVEIMTDKATVEIPSPRAGRVGKRMYAEGQLCPVGKVLITIEMEGAAGAAGVAAVATAGAAAGTEKTSSASASASASATEKTTEKTTGGKGNGTRTMQVLATPATRKLARDVGVDLHDVTGT